MINEVGKKYARPWGNYRTLALSKNHQIKIITVNPSGRLSLQKHSKRSEHWVVVEGNPTITIDEIVKIHRVNDHVFIPIDTAHRIENFSDIPVVIAEIQIGSYLGEDDIIRLDDVYGRS
jgi:mannose-6-phosphate isomerase